MLYKKAVTGLTKRSLESILNEHKTDGNSALYRHSCLTNHENIYLNPILTKDVNYFRLEIKETLKIQEQQAYKSFNGNSGSLKLKL